MRHNPRAVAAAGLMAVPAAAAAHAAVPETAQAGGVHDTLERAVVHEVNTERERRGLRYLSQSRLLARSAARHSHRQLSRDWLGHATARASFAARMRAAVSARHVGETIAFVPRGTRERARTVVRMWMRSPSHRAVVLNSRYRRIGVGRRYGALGGARGTVVTANYASRPR